MTSNVLGQERPQTMVGAGAPVKRVLLLTLFVVLLADEMFGWGLGLGPGLSIKNAFLYSVLVTLMLEIAVTRKPQPLETARVHLPFLLLIAVAAFSWLSQTLLHTGIAYDPVRHFIVLKGGLIDYYLFFLAFFLAAPAREDVLWLVRWIVATLVVVNLVTLVDVYNVPNLGVIEQTRDGRVSGPLGEPNQYGAFVAMFLPVMAALTVGAPRRLKWLYGFGVLLSAWVLLLTVSRGAFVGLLVGAAIAGVLLWRHLSARQVALVAVGSTLVLVVLLALVGEEFLRLLVSRSVSVGERFDAFEASSGRTWIWQVALSQQLEQPLTFLVGFGWNTYNSLNPLNSHNTYLTYLFELGAVGLLLYLWLLVSLIGTVRLGVARAADRPLAIGAIVGLSAVAVATFFVNLFDPWYFIWAFAGLMARLSLLPPPAGAADALGGEGRREGGVPRGRP